MQDLPEIVDRDGNTIHAAKSWGHLASRIKAKSDGDGTTTVPSTSKAKGSEKPKSSRKGKGKEKEVDPVSEDDDNGGWVTEVEIEQVFIFFSFHSEPTLINLVGKAEDSDSMEIDQLEDDGDVDPISGSNVADPPKSNASDTKIATLEASIADLSTRASAAESTLKQQATEAALLDQRFKSCMELLAQRRAQSLRPQIDKLQSTLLKDIEVNDALQKQLAEIGQNSGPVETRIASLLARAGIADGQGKSPMVV